MSNEDNKTPAAFSLDDIDFNEISSSATEPSLENDPQLLQDEQRKRQLFNRIPLTLTLEVASVSVSLAELLAVDKNTVIELNKMAGEPLDLKINGVLFGKAEVVVVNDKYGLRIIEFSGQQLSDLTV